MSLRVDSRFHGGNVAAVRVQENETSSEIFFSADPSGGAEALWFDFRVIESNPDTPHPGTLTLTLEFVRNLTGCDSPSALHPVYRGEGQGWNRARSGRVSNEDGQASVSWTIPYPIPAIEFALCYPYDLHEVRTQVRKSKGYWSTSSIGISQEGRHIPRISNTVDCVTSRPGIYLIARQHAGETPGSWVLDGMLQHFSRTNERRLVIWTVPVADVDGVERGHYGRGGLSRDLDQAWGDPPLRYETRAIQSDLAEWQTRCQPALVLDLQAGGGSESQGVYCYLPQTEESSAADRDSEKWANVLRIALGDEYAAEDFKRERRARPQAAGMSVEDYVRQTLSISALTLGVPYASCGKTMMTPKQYREVGRRIARTAMQRVSGKA